MRKAFLAGLAVLLAACSGREPAVSTTSAEKPAQSSESTNTDDPSISYMRPLPKDADVLVDKPGKCPKCGMTLRSVRIVSAYSCLNNTAFIQEQPGQCRTDGTDLVPISASMFWVCPGAPDKHELNAFKCADGGNATKKFDIVPHGDHNPRHGGDFFMADDAWHHVEGTYQTSGLFRVFFYDALTRPLEPNGFSGSLVVKDSAGKELKTVPLTLSKGIPNAMEARPGKASLPLVASLRVRFKDGDPDKLFDFDFMDYSKEPVIARNQPIELNQPANQTGILPWQESPIPPTTKEILAELTAKADELEKGIDNGAPLGGLWFPALRAKSLVVALVSDHLAEIPLARRVAAQAAANRLLRAAYAIDNFGDLGDRGRILAAHEVFVSALNDLKGVYGSVR